MSSGQDHQEIREVVRALSRTTPLDEVRKQSDGMSIFIVDLRETIGNGMTVHPIPNMVNHETNEPFFGNLEVPAENLMTGKARLLREGLTVVAMEQAMAASIYSANATANK